MPITAIERSRIVREFNQTKFRLVDTLIRWRNHLILRAPNHLESHIFEKINRLLPLLRELKIDKLSEKTKGEFEELKSLIKEYREKRKNLSPQEIQILNSIEKSIRKILVRGGVFEHALLLQEPLTPPQNPFQLASENTLRSQIIKPENLGKLLEVRRETTISLEDLRKVIELPLAEKFRLLIKEAKIEGAHSSVELLTRLLSTLISERLIKEIIRATEKSGEFTQKEIEKAINEINKYLERISEKIRIKIKSESIATEKKPVDLNRIENIFEEITSVSEEQTQTASGNSKVIYKIVYDQKRNIVRVEVISRLTKTEVLKTTADLIRVSPREAISTLVESAAEVLVNDPNARVEVLTTIAETSRMLFSNNRTGETTAKEIVRDLVYTLKNDAPSFLPDSSASETPATNQNSTASVKSAVITSIFSEMPGSALPILLTEHANLSTLGENNFVKKVLEPIMRELATTENGQKHLLNVFGQGKSQSLINSDIGKQLVLECAKSILSRITISSISNSSSPKPRTTVDYNSIIELIVSANQSLFKTENLTIKSALAFMDLLAKIQRAMDPVVTKDIRKASKISQRISELTSVEPGSRKQKVLVQRFVQKALRDGKIRERAKAIRQVLNAARDYNLVVPRQVFGYLYAGLAGINPLLVKSDIPRTYTLPPESAAASSLRRIAAALEAQASRAVARKDPVSWSRVFTLSAQAFLYGTIMRLVRGNLKKVDEIIKALKEKRKLTQVIKLIKKGEIESATEEIAEEILIQELSKLSGNLSLAA